MKKILLIATGGTIACSESEKGLAPGVSAEQLVAYVPQLQQHCQLNTLSLMAIDSTNMTPDKMTQIARCIFDHYLDFDGFVVTHGTDTLGYTSAALTYMLPQLAKPVVVTGSQLAMHERNSDARRNLLDAVRFACTGAKGIYVTFDGLVIHGTHAVKMKTRSMNAFASVNADPVAEVTAEKINFLQEFQSAVESNMPGLELCDGICEDVFLLKVSPGLKPDILVALGQGYRGVVIEGFGIGGIPANLIEAIKTLIGAGVAVVISTQCLEEGIDLGVYAVSQELSDCNIIYGGDMTSEALTMKLMWALGNYDCLTQIKHFMESPVGCDRLLS